MAVHLFIVMVFKFVSIFHKIPKCERLQFVSIFHEIPIDEILQHVRIFHKMACMIYSTVSVSFIRFICVKDFTNINKTKMFI